MRIHHSLLAALRGSSKPSPIPVPAAVQDRVPCFCLPVKPISGSSGWGVCDPSNIGVQFGALTLCSGAGVLLQQGQLLNSLRPCYRSLLTVLLQAPGPAQLLESVAWAGPHHQTRGLRTLRLNKTQRTGLGAQSHQLPPLECLSHPPTTVNIARV